MSDTKLKEELIKILINSHWDYGRDCKECEETLNEIMALIPSSKSTSTDYVNKNKEEWLKASENDGV